MPWLRTLLNLDETITKVESHASARSNISQACAAASFSDAIGVRLSVRWRSPRCCVSRVWALPCESVGRRKIRMFAPRAKRVIYLHMIGAPSQLDMFDPQAGAGRA